MKHAFRMLLPVLLTMLMLPSAPMGEDPLAPYAGRWTDEQNHVTLNIRGDKMTLCFFEKYTIEAEICLEAADIPAIAPKEGSDFMLLSDLTVRDGGTCLVAYEKLLDAKGRVFTFVRDEQEAIP